MDKFKKALKEIRELSEADEKKEKEEEVDKWFENLSWQMKISVAECIWEELSFEDKLVQCNLE